MLTRFLIALLAASLLVAPVVAGPGGCPKPAAANAMVSIEVRFISVAEDFFERIGVDFSHEGNATKMEIIENARPATLLDDKQLRKFLESVEGDIRSNVMHAPKIVVSNGKVANIRCTHQQRYVTGMNAVRQGESLAVCPKSEVFSTGYKLTARPNITADQGAIALKLKASLTNLESEKAPVFPVVIPVMAVGKDGKPDKPVVCTQDLQQPQINTLAVAGELTIPDGGTVLLGGWKRLVEGRCEFGPPVVSKIPYVNRLFRTTGYTRAKENVFVMVTARIIALEEKKPAKASLSAK